MFLSGAGRSFLFGAVLRYSIKKATAVSGDSISNAFDEKG
jgi:hypothetical protein